MLFKWSQDLTKSLAVFSSGTSSIDWFKSRRISQEKNFILTTAHGHRCLLLQKRDPGVFCIMSKKRPYFTKYEFIHLKQTSGCFEDGYVLKYLQNHQGVAYQNQIEIYEKVN